MIFKATYCSRSIGIRLSVLLIAAGLLVACSDAETRFRKHLQSADEYAEKHDFTSAIIELKSALQIDPQAPQARFQLGKMYLEWGDGDAAVDQIQRAIKLGSDPGAAEPSLIRGLILTGHAADALERAEQLAVAQPTPEILVLQATAMLNMGRIEPATKLFVDILAKSPGHIGALVGACRAAFLSDQYETAKGYCDEALVKDPEDHTAHYLLGYIFVKTGRYAAAVESFGVAAKMQRHRINYQLALAMALLRNGDHEAVATLLVELEDLFPNNIAVTYYQGLAAYSAGDFAKAADLFRAVLSRAPAHAQSQLYLAALLARGGHYEQAEELLKVLLTKDGDRLAAGKLLASIQLKSARPEAALETLASIENMPTADAQLYALRGNAMVATGDLDGGIESLTKAMEMAPDSAGVKTALVLAQTQHGLGNEAVAMLEADIALDHDPLNSSVLLIYAHLRQRQWDMAVEAAEKYTGENGDDAYVLNAMGLALKERGDSAGAAQAFERAVVAKPDLAIPLQNLMLLNLMNGNEDAARQNITKLLELNPDDAVALTASGRFAMHAGGQAEAMALFARARQSDPRALEARIQLSRYHLERGQDAAGLQTAAEAAQIAPRDPAVRNLLTRALLKARDFASAAAVADGTLALGEDTAETNYLAGEAQLGQEHLSLAETRLQRVIELEPGHIGALSLLASIAISGGAADTAEKYIEKIRVQLGGGSRAEILRGDLFSKRGDPTAAAAHYEIAHAERPGRETALKLSKAYVRIDKPAKAIQILKDFLQDNPDDVKVQLTLAGALENVAHDLDAARALYRQIVDQNPDSAAAMNNLALILHKQGDLGGAVQLAEKAFALAPDDPSVADTFGWLLIKQGDFERGSSILEKAAANAPQFGDIRYHHAVGLARSGSIDKAIKQLDLALAAGSLEERQAAESLRSSLSARRSR